MGTFLETYILESMMKIGESWMGNDKKYESATKLTNKEKASHKRASWCLNKEVVSIPQILEKMKQC